MAKYVKTEEGYKEIETVNANKMNSDNPVGTGSFSMGRIVGSVIGVNSHAEGFNTTASGNYSHAEGGVTKATSSNDTVSTTSIATNGYYTHAEGYGTVAYGRCSHAEGNGTKSSGNDSHAEGYRTTASGNFSHAEGSDTDASGKCSHAEGGGTKASGIYSHAEGWGTIATGANSHTEGDHTTASGYASHAEGKYTKASGENSHAEGKYNIEDTANKYAHIVGNGTNNSARSNAHTLDWNGVGWFKDSVKVGGVSQDDSAAKTLATTDYVDTTVSTKISGKQDTLIQSGAAVGQIAKITAVDDSGKPTAWEAVDMPSGGGSVPKPLTYDYMPEGYPTKTAQTTVLMGEQAVAFSSTGKAYTAVSPVHFELSEGSAYTVVWDGVEYNCVCYAINSRPYIGNPAAFGLEATREPFFYAPSQNYLWVSYDSAENHTISVVGPTIVYKEIDEKFIPKLYMDKTNPAGEGSFSLNRKADTVIGEYSFAEGRDTIANALCSHAEGFQTTASGDRSHAEGIDTTASGYCSHAEGNNTTAASEYQHVQGKFNIPDDVNAYAHIVGNGYLGSRSNAHTLDWSGNAWFAGNVEGKALILPSSTADSTKKFKITVDDSGTITATEVS